MRRLASIVAGLVWAATVPAGAQEVLARAVDLERQGRWQDAAAAYRVVLARDALNAPALLGMERVFAQLGWRDSTLAMAQRALALSPANSTARAIEVRTARARGGAPAVAEALQRWITAAPRSDEPWREMVRQLVSDGRVDDAREAVARARAVLGDPERLRADLAAVEAAAGNWPRAAAEWRALVERQSAALISAAFALQQTPPAARDRVLRALTEPDSSRAARRLAADLLLRWNEPARAWSVMQGALPAEPEQRATTLRAFADRARVQQGGAAQRVAAEALEAMARVLGPDEAARARVESARAYAAAGDAASARRVLEAMARDPAAPQTAAASAAATLIELSVREGNAAEAARLLEAGRARLAGGEYARLAQTVARAWLMAGSLDRAEATIAPDSSLAGDEVRGWIALYRGRLDEASALLRAAGVRAGDQAGPAERAAVVALLQAVELDTSTALGEALFKAERGDTAGAVRSLANWARAGAVKGRPEVLFHAGRLAVLSGDGAGAETLWGEVAANHGQSSVAAASLLHLARALGARGQALAAVRHLERLILDYPESALAPEARRELDRLRGLVPRS